MDNVFNMHEAKSQLSKLVALARQGETVTIAIHGKPVVKLVPVDPQPLPPQKCDGDILGHGSAMRVPQRANVQG